MIYIYTDHAYRESNIFILKAKVISSFLEECCLDFFSNEPLFINLESDKAFGYCLEGPELDSGIFFQLDLKKLYIKRLFIVIYFPFPYNHV